MPIPAATIATFAPWGNAQLAFQVTGGAPITEDPETGDPIASTTTLEYLAHVTISQPDWQKSEGADQSLYRCRGRLLAPRAFDPRVTNGSKATATVNGLQGRFELTFDLAASRAEAPEIGQAFDGTFRIVGRG